MLAQYSDEIANLVAKFSPRLVHIGGRGISGRTGIVLESGIVISLARQARDNEEIEIMDCKQKSHKAVVSAYDYRTGLVVLRSSEVGMGLKRIEAASDLKLGEVCVVLANPSPVGPEAVLSNIRFKGSKTEWGGLAVNDYFQTANPAFPGFGGSLVVNAGGEAVGLVVHNQQGNEGWCLGIADWLKMVDELIENGSYHKPTIGVQLVPSSLSDQQATIANAQEGLLIQTVEAKSPAQNADLRSGDIIVSIDDKEIGPWPLFSRARPAKVKILRGETVLNVEVVPR